MSADRKPLAFQTPTKQARTVSRTFSMIGRRSKKSAGSRTKRETGWCRISLSEFLFSFVLLFFFFFFGGRGKSDNRRNRLDRGLKGNWLIHDFIFSFCFFLSTRFCRKILRFEYFFYSYVFDENFCIRIQQFRYSTSFLTFDRSVKVLKYIKSTRRKCDTIDFLDFLIAMLSNGLKEQLRYDIAEKLYKNE